MSTLRRRSKSVTLRAYAVTHVRALLARGAARRPRLALAGVLCLSGFLGCDCGAGPKVPFKLGAEDASTDAAPTESVNEPTSATFAPNEAPQALEGAALPWSSVRAALAYDLDQDGDRDVIALHDDASGAVHLVFAQRNADSFETPREILTASPHAGDAECVVEYAELKALSTSKALALFSRVCGAQGSPERRAEPRTYVLLSLEPTPRVLAQVSEHTSDEAPEPFFAIDGQSIDADNDGHDDVALTFQPRGYGSADDTLRLVWFDRPSGLVRDVREPEATLKTWADAARAQVTKSPEFAIERAELTLQVRSALCTEAGSPSVWFSERPGVACGAGKSAQSALLTSALAHARLGNIRKAFDAYKRLKQLGGSGDPKADERLDAALLALPSAPGIVLTRGARVEVLDAPQVRLPAARFLGESSLLVQRAEPVIFDLNTGDESALQLPQDALVRDPSGQLAVTALEHSCSGYSLRIERAPLLGERYFAMPGVSALLSPETASPDCNLKSRKSFVRAGVFSVLGWAPQGVVVALGSEVRIVPLDLAGKPAGSPRVLPERSPLPAPLPAGAASPDGGRYVEATPFGILVYNVRDGETELWRPEGYASLAKAAREAAVSPSGRRVVVISGDTFYTLGRAP